MTFFQNIRKHFCLRGAPAITQISEKTPALPSADRLTSLRLFVSRFILHTALSPAVEKTETPLSPVPQPASHSAYLSAAEHSVRRCRAQSFAPVWKLKLAADIGCSSNTWALDTISDLYDAAKALGGQLPPAHPVVKVTYLYPIVKAVYAAPAPAAHPTIKPDAILSRKERLAATRHTSVSLSFGQNRCFSVKPEVARAAQTVFELHSLENAPLVKQARQFSLPMLRNVSLRPEIRTLSVRNFSARKLSGASNLRVNHDGALANGAIDTASSLLKSGPKKYTDSSNGNMPLDDVLGLYNGAFRSLSVSSVKDTTTAATVPDITLDDSARASTTATTCASVADAHVDTSAILERVCPAPKDAQHGSSFVTNCTAAVLPPTINESANSIVDHDEIPEASMLPPQNTLEHPQSSSFSASNETSDTTSAVTSEITLAFTSAVTSEITLASTSAVTSFQDTSAIQNLSDFWKFPESDENATARSALVQSVYNTQADDTNPSAGEDEWEDIDLGDHSPAVPGESHISARQELLEALDTFNRDVWVPAARGWRSIVNSAARRLDVGWMRGITSTPEP
ncbi:hypothetical protein BZA70DRAFT_270494 [Myxozyma melibiosi]|uniref:Uncharacterized protein n=1 Tax=Myxozyma melibiosi TaxID=54550 RepID=A0ABR1FB86_9ASCO